MRKIILISILSLVLIWNAPAYAQGDLPTELAESVTAHVERFYGKAALVDSVAIYDERGELRAYAAQFAGDKSGYAVVDLRGRVLESAEGSAFWFTCAGQVVRFAPLEYACKIDDQYLNEQNEPMTLDFPAPLLLDAPARFSALGFGLDYFGTGYIDDVPDYNQFITEDGCYSGCGPTAAANVIEWWSVNSFATRLQNDDLVRDLRGRMGTWCQNGEGWTTFAAVRDGMESYTIDRDYAVTVTLGAEANYADYRAEIDAGRPAVLVFKNQSEYGNHAVTGVGYQDDYFVVHDGRAATAGEVLISSASGFDYWRMISYEVWGATPEVTNTTPISPFLPYCVPISLTVPGAVYSFTYDVDNLTADVDHTHNRSAGIGIGCTAGVTDINHQCVITDPVATCNGGGTAGLCVDGSVTENYLYSVTHALVITDLSGLDNLCVDLTSGSYGNPAPLRASNLRITYSYELTRGRCISCCRNEDPELFDSAAWEGDATFDGSGVVTLTNGAIITTTTQFMRNNDFTTPPSLIQQIFDWQAQWTPGYYQLAATGMVWQTGRLAAGTYTMTASAKAVNTYSTRFGFTLWGWTNYHNHEFTITNTENFTDYAYAFTVTTDTYNVMVYMPFGVTGNVILDSVTLERADSQTLRLSQLLYQNVYIPQYALSRLTIIARAATAGTKLQAHVDGRLVGQASLQTTWYTYTDFIFVNDLAGMRDVIINFYSDNAGETVEIDYVCLSHDGNECIPYAQGGPRNPSFTEYESGPSYDKPLYWDTNPDAWHTRWITTQEALFPDTMPWGEISPYLEQLSSKYYFPNLRVTYAARLPDGVTGTIGTVDSWWSYQGRDWPGVYPRIGGAECEITSDDRAECSYSVGIDGAYALLGEYYLHFNIPPQLSSSDPTPVALIIDDVCVQVDVPQPASTPTPLPTQQQGAPNSTPAPTNTPTPSRTPLNTPLPTYTTGPGTPTRTPDATRVYPTFTPMATYTAQPTYTPGATATSPSAPTDVPGTATITPTALDTPTAYPTAAAQPTVDPLVDAECCTYCIYYDSDTETIEEAGSISCAGCDNCVLPDTPTAPDTSILNVLSIDFWREWFYWLVSWIGWIGNLIGWLVCKGYYKWICPIICLLQTWFKFLWYSLQSWAGLPYDIWNYFIGTVLPVLQDWWDALLDLMNTLGTLFETFFNVAMWLLEKCCCTPVYALLGFLTYFVRQSDYCARALQPTPGAGTPTWTPTPTDISQRPKFLPAVTPTGATPRPTMPWQAPTPTLMPCETPVDVTADFGIPTSCAAPSGFGEIVWCFIIGGLGALQDYPVLNVITVWAPRASMWAAAVVYIVRRVQNLVYRK